MVNRFLQHMTTVFAATATVCRKWKQQKQNIDLVTDTSKHKYTLVSATDNKNIIPYKMTFSDRQEQNIL
jgi:hypothetical protein